MSSFTALLVSIFIMLEYTSPLFEISVQLDERRLSEALIQGSQQMSDIVAGVE